MTGGLFTYKEKEMTREEAIKHLQTYSSTNGSGITTQEQHEEAKRVAIQALSQECVGSTQKHDRNALDMRCDDAISRDMALEKMADYVASGYADSAEDFEEYSRIICQLPPVTQKSGKWIPVSERLPEDAQEVLYSTKTGRVFHGEYYDDNTDRKWFSYKDDMFSFNNVVTAWMPLPKPYEPQESEVKTDAI